MEKQKLYHAWNRKGQPIAKVGDDFLRPIAEKLSLVNDYIFGDKSYFVDAPSVPTDFCNVVECVEPAPIWMPRMESCPILPIDEIMSMLRYPVGSINSPINPETYVEGKLDEMRCYMVVWNDRVRKTFTDKRGGYIGYDLGLFTTDKYPNLKGKAVIHDIVAKWAYCHRKAWLEQDNFLPWLHLESKNGGLTPYDEVFVNKRVKLPSKTGGAECNDYHNNVYKAVARATAWDHGEDWHRCAYPPCEFKWYEGIVMKHKFHHYRVHYIKPHEVGKAQTVNVGEWEKLRWD
jgi:hypothetical protein